MKVLGQHILVEFCDCDPFALNNKQMVQQYMNEAAVRSNATVVASVFHHFSPYGVSGVVFIAEAHLAIHTWPEYGYAAVDLFTCGTSVDPWRGFEYLKNCFKARYYTITEMKRGIPEQSSTQVMREPAYVRVAP